MCSDVVCTHCCAQELRGSENEAGLIFDGGGTRWIDELKQADHKLAPLYNSLKQAGVIAGVCDYCIDAYDGDRPAVTAEELPLVAEYNGHPGIAQRQPVWRLGGSGHGLALSTRKHPVSR